MEEDSEDSEAELESLIADLKANVVYPISPISVKGLSGFHVTYRSIRTQYYEARFDIAEGGTFLLVVDTNGDILDIDCAALLSSVDPRLENGDAD